VSGQVYVHRHGAVGWLVLDHPERRNAISVDMWRALPGLVAELARDPGVRVVGIRGAGEEAFAAGADISEFELARTGEDRVAGYDRVSGEAVLALDGLPKPLIALIHGYCLGGGVTLALTADLRYAADDASFSVPAARLGLGYAAPGIEKLVQLVGPAAAKELFFTARRFSAAEALRMGLLNGVIAKADLDAAVEATAGVIAANAPLTVRSVKLIVDELARPPENRDGRAMAESVRACFESDDYREGARAFLEKRPPRFRGK
jgi:enoyl-CoA hydratase